MLTIPSLLEARAIEQLRREEIEEARAIQSVMLPADVLRVGQVTVAYEFQPVETVGGDFLDYFQLPDSSVGFYVGDVSGKGLPAAMYAALAVGILRGIHKTGQSPGTVLSILNQRLTSRGGLRRHAAILYGLFNPETSEMTLASAGMPGPLHFSATGCRIIELSGIPSGLFPGSEYEAVSITLQPGDSIVCCSDGITEAQNARYEDFGIERLIAICNEGAHLPPEELLAGIFSAVNNFTHVIRQHDDMAAAIFQLQR